MASIPSERITVGGAAVAQQERLLFDYYLYYLYFNSPAANPHPPSSLVLSTPTTSRLTMALRERRRF
jgi:hypothetical protein